MINCAEASKILMLASQRAKNELAQPTEKLMKLVELRSKAMIGHYQAGWAPLAVTTLEGFGSFPGKIALGYAPPDNPLLRDGTLRNSIGGYAERITGGAFGVVGSDDKAALYAEIGTRTEPPRSFLGMALLQSLDEAEVVFGAFALSLFQGYYR